MSVPPPRKLRHHGLGTVKCLSLGATRNQQPDCRLPDNLQDCKLQACKLKGLQVLPANILGACSSTAWWPTRGRRIFLERPDGRCRRLFRIFGHFRRFWAPGPVPNAPASHFHQFCTPQSLKISFWDPFLTKTSNL